MRYLPAVLALITICGCTAPPTTDEGQAAAEVTDAKVQTFQFHLTPDQPSAFLRFVCQGTAPCDRAFELMLPDDQMKQIMTLERPDEYAVTPLETAVTFNTGDWSQLQFDDGSSLVPGIGNLRAQYIDFGRVNFVHKKLCFADRTKRRFLPGKSYLRLSESRSDEAPDAPEPSMFSVVDSLDVTVVVAYDEADLPGTAAGAYVPSCGDFN